MSSAAPDISDVFAIHLPPRPYPGLRPFEKSEWPIFFGRERMTDAVVARLIERRFLVVHGDSGCGKSSLIRAGVLPRLEQEAARGGTRWLTCYATPGDEPVRNFATALSGLRRRENDPLPVDFRRAINCGRSGAVELVKLLEGANDHVCILLDQFEEIFAHARRRGPQEARLLIDLLIGIQELGSPRLCVILTMRSEFLGACAQFRGFAEAVNATQYLLPRMSHSDLVRAIREPASLYDGEVTFDLAEHLINEARGGQDQLSLVQHGLMLLYRNDVLRAPASPGPWRLSRQSYQGEGGLAKLLSDHADEVMQRAAQLAERPEQVLQIAESLFRALTDINADGQATRLPQKLGRLLAVTGSDESTLRAIIEQFRADGVSFLRPYGTQPLTANDYVDISHESLIRCWWRIADPRDGWLIREFKNGLIWRSLLVQVESFEASPDNVLSAATTEERSEWLKHRNAAWSERYGGGWPRVQKLMTASLARLESDARAAEAERARVEEAHSREQQLQSELALAHERGRRERVFRVGFALVLLLAMVTVAMAFVAHQNSKAAKAESARLTAALKGSQLRGNVAAAKSKAAQQTIEALTVTTEDLVRVAQQTTPADSPATREISQARNSLNQQVAALRRVTQVPPSVHIRLADEGQRAAARDLQLRLGNLKFGDAFIDIPDIELLSALSRKQLSIENGKPQAAVLRCFRAWECSSDGKRLTDLINAQLKVPLVTLQDVTRNYGSTSQLRDRQFELWFGPGSIELQGAVEFQAAGPTEKY